MLFAKLSNALGSRSRRAATRTLELKLVGKLENCVRPLAAAIVAQNSAKLKLLDFERLISGQLRTPTTTETSRALKSKV